MLELSAGIAVTVAFLALCKLTIAERYAYEWRKRYIIARRALRRGAAEHKASIEHMKRPTLYAVANRFATHYFEGPDPEALSN